MDFKTRINHICHKNVESDSDFKKTNMLVDSMNLDVQGKYIADMETGVFEYK